MSTLPRFVLISVWQVALRGTPAQAVDGQIIQCTTVPPGANT